MSGEIRAAVQADTTDTVRELRDQIARQMGSIDVYNLMGESGLALDDKKTLSECGIQPSTSSQRLILIPSTKPCERCCKVNDKLECRICGFSPDWYFSDQDKDLQIEFYDAEMYRQRESQRRLQAEVEWLESIFPHTSEEHEVLDLLVDEEDWEQSASEGYSSEQIQLKEARKQRECREESHLRQCWIGAKRHQDMMETSAAYRARFEIEQQALLREAMEQEAEINDRIRENQAAIAMEWAAENGGLES